MKVLIIEDERHTANRLASLLHRYDITIVIAGVLGSVRESVDWLKTNERPDLIFQDIQLNDGNCFEIYEQVRVETPVIFTTAYSEFALKSFEVNSIAYLVKPYDFGDITSALEKFRAVREYFLPPETDLLKELLASHKKTNKKRFLVKTGDRYQSINAADVAWFVFDEGVTFAFTFAKKRYPLNYSIDQLSALLAPDDFFRINRKYVISFRIIGAIHSWFGSRLKVETTPPTPEELVVSRERVSNFKRWLDR